jgi:hypothetical protein
MRIFCNKEISTLLNVNVDTFVKSQIKMRIFCYKIITIGLNINVHTHISTK